MANKELVKISVGVCLTEPFLFYSSKPGCDVPHYLYAVNCKAYERLRQLTPQAQGQPVTRSPE